MAGSFVANGDELHATLDPQNFARYQPMVAVISKLDMQKLAAVYMHFYPLFQQAYQDLGYPNGYFNDRLVQVIDDAAGDAAARGPIELVRPNVMYQYRRSGARGAARRAEIADPHGAGQCRRDQGEAHGIARGRHRGAAQAIDVDAE